MDKKISQIVLKLLSSDFLAFSEYLNFTLPNPLRFILYFIFHILSVDTSLFFEKQRVCCLAFFLS